MPHGGRWISLSTIATTSAALYLTYTRPTSILKLTGKADCSVVNIAARLVSKHGGQLL